jgi:23S rRNA (cytidine1920-2'-O)/16S rRNA (cytidine1409-2'-O)-methyltransferase
MEGYNARFIDSTDLPYTPEVIVADLSFISLRLVFAPLAGVLEEDGELIALVKPQFEAGRGKVGRKGVVREPEVHREVLAQVLAAAGQHGFALRDVAPSPLRGADGNIEFFVWWRKQAQAEEADAASKVKMAMEEVWGKK